MEAKTKMLNFEIKNGSVTSPKGFKAAGINCGLKEKKKDLALIKSDVPATVAAVFTTNRVAAAPVLISRENAAKGTAQAIIINSGGANACTGQQGLADAREMTELTAQMAGIKPELVLVASTGVIGKYLPMNIIRKGITEIVPRLASDGGTIAAQAIMTTDMHPKNFSVAFELDDKKCTIGAIAKGSGMISPNMATMIMAITTDVNIQARLLQDALKTSVDISLNALTVDGDMSTNDSVFLLANGMSGNYAITSKNENYEKFVAALKAICLKMTRVIAMDGEGATKLVTITVENALNHEQANRAAKAIANSLLVKTAIFGMDPNWGRVISATGASGVEMNLEAVSIRFAGITVAENGAAIPFDFPAMKKALADKEIAINISLGMGNHSATVYTCDLTYDYVKINAEYHT
jgi:glutamate N-acetyltransferase/amino-acid N-acetyltransferase